MTRYSNPLPHSQVPNTQGRPAAPGAQAKPSPYGAPSEDPAAAWSQNGVPRSQGRPAGGQYPYADPQPHVPADPYAALRPDGFGYSPPQKPADPYGLAGYTAPHAPAPAANPYARAPQAQSATAYPPPNDPYGASMGGYAPSASQPAPAAPSPFASAGAPPIQNYAAQNGYPAAPPPSSYSTGAYGGPAPANGAYNDLPQWGNPSSSTPAHGNGQSLSVDARDYGHGGYGDVGGQVGQWGDAYAETSFDPALGAGMGGSHAPAVGQAYAGAPPQQHASFDQSYAEDEGAYEEEPRRGNWKKVVGLVACTVLVGGVLAIAYSSIMGPSTGEPTPLVKGAEGPSKVKPSDPGGKQFAHADSKIMGRLGEGSSDDASSDVSGVRKVPVVVVGRDGSIQPPATEAAAVPTSDTSDSTSAVVAVPGLTVIDGLGGPTPNRPVAPKAEKSPPVQMVTASAPERPVVVSPPAKTVKVDADQDAVKPAKKVAATEETAALPARVTDPAPPKKQKVAALDTAAPSSAPVSKPTGAGYVAVLASVPASGSSRMDALKQFADMQQKYGAILTNKTPDIQEANLGEKGTYHRLLVGPPGSRDAANSVCTQLKAQGYAGCWVTAY